MVAERKHADAKYNHYAIILSFVVIGAFTIGATYLGVHTLSGVRAYITGEGEWTKAQKEATAFLMQYNVRNDPKLYEQFRNKLSLNKNFGRSYKAMTAVKIDHDEAVRGLQTSSLNAEDINLMVWLAYYVDYIPVLSAAFDIWEDGNEHITELEQLGERLHRTLEAGEMTEQRQNEFMKEITEIDGRLTVLERSFSETMGDAARWVQNVIFWAHSIIGLILVVGGYATTRYFFKRINSLNTALRKREDQLNKVLSNTQDVIYQLDFDTQKYVYVSPSVKQMLGYTPADLIEGGSNFVTDRIHPDDLSRMEQELEEMRGRGLDKHFASETEFRIKDSSGNYVWINNKRSLVTNDEGEPVAIVGSVRDISERKQYEVEIEQALKEKQTLLEEIHHRVKNNLAVISSLLELQKNETGQDIESILGETQSRIQSIAIIHEKLYQTETLSEIDIKEYIRDFAEVIASTYRSDYQKVAIETDLEQFSLDITKAVPLGLIVNELLNNAFKHGFSDKKKGHLQIELEKTSGNIRLCISDDGHGLPVDFDLDRQQSLGMTLIKTLTRQLNGKLNVQKEPMTTFKLVFPL